MWRSLTIAGVTVAVTCAGTLVPVDGRETTRTIGFFQYGPGASNHPVHVVPSDGVSIPRDWPLAPDGSITCMTCHARPPGTNANGRPQLRGGGLDRGEDAAVFCVNCHRTDGPRTAAAMHWMAVSSAHMLGGSGRGHGARAPRYGGSRRCLGCHDGVNAADDRGGHKPLGDTAWNHPIDVRYPAAFSTGADARTRDTSFRPTSTLPGSVRLPGGRVGCVSCHDLYGGRPGRLSVPLNGSALCLTCHRMD